MLSFAEALAGIVNFGVAIFWLINAEAFWRYVRGKDTDNLPWP